MKIIRFLKNSDKYISTTILLFLLVLTLLQIILRTVFNMPFIGVEELLRYLFIAAVFMGLSYSVKNEGHIRLEGLQRHLSPNYSAIVELIIQFSSVIVFSIITFSAIISTIHNFQNVTPTLSIPFWLFFFPTITGFGMLSLVHISIFLKKFKELYRRKNQEI